MPPVCVECDECFISHCIKPAVLADKSTIFQTRTTQGRYINDCGRENLIFEFFKMQGEKKSIEQNVTPTPPNFLTQLQFQA